MLMLNMSIIKINWLDRHSNWYVWTETSDKLKKLIVQLYFVQNYG